jgi:pseudouridine-5'-phosphate glycosidase
MTNPMLALSAEVSAALAAGKSVVALESTIIAHGMPWPQNVDTARAVEAIVREVGATPATIAVIGGKIRVGLSDDELVALARANDVLKLSRADLPYALTSGRTGATTIAATMICAALAGIRVFGTGGLGGVHRGAENTFDISADLTELARTNVVVVAGGPKALLDLPKTLEVLETYGVPVIGYRTDEFPAFWSRSSGLPIPLRLDSPGDIAAFIAARDTLGLDGGVLVTNAIPEYAEIPRAEIVPIIDAAVREAAEKGIRGKDVTPHILRAIFDKTGARSLEANIALVKSNVRLAAEISVAVAPQSTL